MWQYTQTDELYHHGIKGMKWGKRRFQNKDGTLTPQGKKRYQNAVKDYDSAYDKWSKKQDSNDKKWEDIQGQYKKLGRTKLSRIINAAKGNTKEAKAYRKSYDEWSKKQDSLDREYDKVREKFKSTGRNYVERVFNNIKYGD